MLTSNIEGRGYVIVDQENGEFIVNNQAFDIDVEGKIGTVDGRGKGWIMSVYHQLHCLVSTALSPCQSFHGHLYGH